MLLPIRINPTTLPALVFGGLLLAIAIGLCLTVWRSRRAVQHLVANDDRARLHADRQFRRRIQISVMLAAVGILIAAGDQMDKIFIQRPLYFVIWVLSVFGLVTWLVLMALGDWLSTVAFSSVALSQLRHERQELEEEIRRYRAMKNGDPGDQSQNEIFPESTQ